MLVYDDIIFKFNHIYLVLDAFGKPETGLLKGNVQWRGSFKECTETVIKGNHTFKGQYCTAHLMNRTTSNHTQLGGSMVGRHTTIFHHTKLGGLMVDTTCYHHTHTAME